ncbi:MAG TPA: CoB--CoM heterodisulfide reductase iron-sulfur subunit B family protein, partial [Armatimonadota bacterium]
IELQEIPDWNCCGATSAHSMNKDLSVALPLRNLAKAEEMGMDVIAPCAACFNRLKSADAAIKDDPTLTASMAEKTGVKYNGSIQVLSLLEAIAGLNDEDIKQQVKRELKGLKVACYYGCLLLRPPGMIHFDDAENPVSLEKIMSDIGVETVDWPYRNECCGASLSLSRPEIVVKLTHDILSHAKKAGANCVVTACPLCQGNLDMRQPDIAAKYGEKFDMPIFYFTQLMGMAFGLPTEFLGLRKLMVDPMPLLLGVGSR